MEKKIEKKVRGVRFIPIVLIELTFFGFRTLETSSYLYEDVSSARDCLDNMKKLYGDFPNVTVIRSSIVRKVFEL